MRVSPSLRYDTMNSDETATNLWLRVGTNKSMEFRELQGLANQSFGWQDSPGQGQTQSLTSFEVAGSRWGLGFLG